ncbi:MAG: hypothetical protein ACRYG8_12815 [Janthinobacterium lividum]
MRNHVIARVVGVVSLLGAAACDNTYTPSAHHQEAASTGSMLSGVDTGSDGTGTMNNPSLTSNYGGPQSHGH